jgi:hypothetical protein
VSAVHIVNFWTASDADYVKRFIYKQNGTAVNLTGSVLRLKARKQPTDAEAFINISSDAGRGIVITSAVDGDFTLTFARDRLARMQAGDYVHDLVRVRPDGLVERIWRGTLTHEIGASR